MWVRDIVLDGAGSVVFGVIVMLHDARQRGYRPRTLGADKGYDTRKCVRAMRNRVVTPHLAHHEAWGLPGEPDLPFPLTDCLLVIIPVSP